MYPIKRYTIDWYRPRLLGCNQTSYFYILNVRNWPKAASFLDHFQVEITTALHPKADLLLLNK